MAAAAKGKSGTADAAPAAMRADKVVDGNKKKADRSVAKPAAAGKAIKAGKPAGKSAGNAVKGAKGAKDGEAVAPVSPVNPVTTWPFPLEPRPQ